MNPKQMALIVHAEHVALDDLVVGAFGTVTGDYVPLNVPRRVMAVAPAEAGHVRVYYRHDGVVWPPSTPYTAYANTTYLPDQVVLILRPLIELPRHPARVIGRKLTACDCPTCRPANLPAL